MAWTTSEIINLINTHLLSTKNIRDVEKNRKKGKSDTIRKYFSKEQVGKYLFFLLPETIKIYWQNDILYKAMYFLEFDPY